MPDPFPTKLIPAKLTAAGAAVLLAATLVVAGCGTDFTAPENISAFEVTLDVQGTLDGSGPDGQSFVLSWSHPESNRSGQAPVNPELIPKRFEPVPLGRVILKITEEPTGCVVPEPSQEITVVDADTVRASFVAECGS